MTPQTKHPARTTSRGFRPWIAALIGFLSLGAIFLLFSALSLHEIEALRSFPGQEPESATIPFLIPSNDNQSLTVDVRFFLVPVFHPTWLRIKPDDCLDTLVVNDTAVDESIAKFCDYGEGRVLHLGTYLHGGWNTMHVVIGDQGGETGLKLYAAKTDPLILFVDALLLLLVCIVVAYMLFLGKKMSAHQRLMPAIVGGVFLRVFYYLFTPYAVRGHDTDAHIDYIRYVSDHLLIPPAQDGWEYHQAPLYYFISGIWMKILTWFRLTDAFILQTIHASSMLLSVGTVGVSAWIAKILFPKKTESHLSLLFLSLVVSLPSFVFLASRISNDPLYQLEGLLFLALLLVWWRTPSWKTWYAVAFVCAISLLTKVSASVFVVAMFLTLLLRTGVPFKKKFLHGSLALLLLFILTAWLPFLRLYIEEDTSRTLSLGNQGMHSGLSVPSEPKNMLTFDPVQVVTHAFNNPWEDSARRQFFPEYFYRSAFFGEFQFEHKEFLASCILFLGMIAMLLCLGGIAYELLTVPKKNFPMWLILGLLFAASVSYRLRFPYSANQDFRFVVMSIIPLSYYAVIGASVLAKPVRRICMGCLWLLVCLNSAFLLWASLTT